MIFRIICELSLAQSYTVLSQPRKNQLICAQFYLESQVPVITTPSPHGAVLPCNSTVDLAHIDFMHTSLIICQIDATVLIVCSQPGISKSSSSVQVGVSAATVDNVLRYNVSQLRATTQTQIFMNYCSRDGFRSPYYLVVCYPGYDTGTVFLSHPVLAIILSVLDSTQTTWSSVPSRRHRYVINSPCATKQL